MRQRAMHDSLPPSVWTFTSSTLRGPSRQCGRVSQAGGGQLHRHRAPCLEGLHLLLETRCILIVAAGHGCDESGWGKRGGGGIGIGTLQEGACPLLGVRQWWWLCGWCVGWGVGGLRGVKGDETGGFCLSRQSFFDFILYLLQLTGSVYWPARRPQLGDEQVHIRTRLAALSLSLLCRLLQLRSPILVGFLCWRRRRRREFGSQ